MVLARLIKSLAPEGVSLAQVTAYLARQSTENGAGTITSMLRQVRAHISMAVHLSGQWST
jgi:hypothetical protein